MRETRDLISSAMSAPAQAAPKAARKLDPATVDVVNDLFIELQAIFPAWRRAWPDDKSLAAAKRSWVRAFVASGIDRIEQIRFGLAQCRVSGSDFAPSVGRFIEWCAPTPEQLGLPATRDAYREACRIAHPTASADGVHAAVYHAATEVGFWELANLPEQKSYKLFERVYGAVVQMVLGGKPLREVPKALPPSVSVCTPEVGRAALAGLRSSLGGVRA